MSLNVAIDGVPQDVGRSPAVPAVSKVQPLSEVEAQPQTNQDASSFLPSPDSEAFQPSELKLTDPPDLFDDYRGQDARYYTGDGRLDTQSPLGQFIDIVI